MQCCTWATCVSQNHLCFGFLLSHFWVLVRLSICLRFLCFTSASGGHFFFFFHVFTTALCCEQNKFCSCTLALFPHILLCYLTIASWKLLHHIGFWSALVRTTSASNVAPSPEAYDLPNKFVSAIYPWSAALYFKVCFPDIPWSCSYVVCKAIWSSNWEKYYTNTAYLQSWARGSHAIFLFFNNSCLELAVGKAQVWLQYDGKFFQLTQQKSSVDLIPFGYHANPLGRKITEMLIGPGPFWHPVKLGLSNPWQHFCPTYKIESCLS